MRRESPPPSLISMESSAHMTLSLRMSSEFANLLYDLLFLYCIIGFKRNKEIKMRGATSFHLAWWERSGHLLHWSPWRGSVHITMTVNMLSDLAKFINNLVFSSCLIIFRIRKKDRRWQSGLHFSGWKKSGHLLHLLRRGGGVSMLPFFSNLVYLC